MIILLFLLTFISSCLLTYLIRWYALHQSLLDIPNHRSSHAVPTPRGGGLSVVLVFLLSLFILNYFSWLNINTITFSGIITSSLFIAGIGFWDDHQHIPARWRIIVHLSASLFALWCLPELPAINLFSLTINLSIFKYLFYSVLLVWLLNLYNFMDGIDGIASVEALSVCSGVALLLFIQRDVNEMMMPILLFCCVAGFLFWNFPHAKIFMGDACSGFLGFILGFLAILTSLTSTLNIWSWLILLAVFIADASFTLIKRFLSGQVWYEAHRSHAYQHYAMKLQQQFEHQGLEDSQARTKAHRQINFQMLLINFCWLLPLATVAVFYPFWGGLLTLIAFTPLVWLANFLNAGKST